MKGWLMSKYGKFGVSVSRESDELLSLSFPKDFANFSDVVQEVDERYGAVCDLSYDESGGPEVVFWKGSRTSDSSAGLRIVAGVVYIAAGLFAVAATLCIWPLVSQWTQAERPW